MNNLFDAFTPLIGDIHNHCGISYGHGTLEEAFANASERLDFVSVTGHALWPDMPSPNERNQHMLDFHNVGFERLSREWPKIVAATRQFDKSSSTVPFLGFEMHSLADGDLTIIYRDLDGALLQADSAADMQQKIRGINKNDRKALALPHHIGYRRGHRGINWQQFANDVSPIVEIVSMHGCAEDVGGPRPYLHTMGPADHHGTMLYGLNQGHRFGVIGSTDHHSGHPGSHGHGLMGVWALTADRNSIWDAIWARRTWAMSGDRVDLAFSVDGTLMGSCTKSSTEHRARVDTTAGSPIDCIDIIRDGKLIHRHTPALDPELPKGDTILSRLTLELGWGPRNEQFAWKSTLEIPGGRILSVEPRFRGREVVSPTDITDDDSGKSYESHWWRNSDSSIGFETVSYGNPTNSTSGTQAISLLIEAPSNAHIQASVNERKFDYPLERLMEGGIAEPMADMPATSVHFHRAPRLQECTCNFEITDIPNGAANYYYARVRLQNGHFAWSSPVFIDHD